MDEQGSLLIVTYNCLDLVFSFLEGDLVRGIFYSSMRGFFAVYVFKT